MQTLDDKTKITALEAQLVHYEKLLDQSIANNEVLAKTKVIFHELKKVSERLSEIRQQNEARIEHE